MNRERSTHIRRAEIIEKDEAAAVEAFVNQVTQPDMAGVIFFCSADYDLEKLSAALNGRFSCPIMGCTSAGEIGAEYQQGGIVGASFPAGLFHMQMSVIQPLNRFNDKVAREMAAELVGNLKFSDFLNPEEMFGFLLIDGLSMLEDQVIGPLYNSLNGVSVIGGSAADTLEFKQTQVYADGHFTSGAAVFALIESKLPFKVFKHQHFEPSDKDMVITESDPARRLVKEIDGEPAAVAYAEILGLDTENLDAHVFSTYPLMLQIGNEWYVRSIGHVNDDGSLSFYCAIDDGLPLTVANGVSFLDALADQVERLKEECPNIELTLGCDCILRRLEMMDFGKQKATETLLNQIKFLGFSTFGEQFNALHVNQTLTGVVLYRD